MQAAPHSEPSRPLSSNAIARRRFNALGLASLSSWLVACGGGTQEGSAEATTRPLTHVAAPLPTPPGMLAGTPWAVAGPTPNQLALKTMAVLADQRIAIAWTESPAPGEVGPRRLRLRIHGCQPACSAQDARELTLSEGVADSGSAVAVLPDGSTLLVWRDLLERVPGHDLSEQHRLWLQRYRPSGEPAGSPELVDSFIFSTRLARSGRVMGPPSIGVWVDGSFVITWADILSFGSFPGLSTSVRARRYHANGWPVAEAATVSVSSREQGYTLSMPAATGGYVISHVTPPLAPFYQTIRAMEFWNPLPPSALEKLLPGSFLLGLGVYGSVLFAARYAPGTTQPVYTRERFGYHGQPLGPIATVQALPDAAIALGEGEFLALGKAPSPLAPVASAAPGRSLAQRMDAFGRILGLPFELPGERSVLLADGSLVVGWTTSAPGAGGDRIQLQRFVPSPMATAPFLAPA